MPWRSVAMRVGWSALMTILVTASAARLEPEAQQVLHALKRRILAELGMKSLPDMRRVNTTEAEMQRMTRKYLRNVKKSERELLTFHHTECERNSHVVFQPEVEYDSHVQWARLNFPNSTVTAVSGVVRRWHQDEQDTHLTFPCRHCCGAKLELSVQSSAGTRAKRSACGRQCCRRSLRISFQEIGWEWVVEPKSFEAFYCKGRCRGSTDDVASTHALLQSIVSVKRNREVSRPCCAPRKLRPLLLVHYNNKKPPELVTTSHEGMIVKECACT